MYASIDENNSAATTNVPGESTPKDIADIDQQFIALNLSKNDVEKTEAVVNAAISDVKSIVEEKKLGLHESLARKKAEQIVKEDVVKYGNANFTQARLLNIGDKILEEFRASDLIFKKNPDGTPTPLSNEEFEDLKIAFKKSFIASLTKQGLIKEGEPEKQTKETGGTSIDNTDAKYSTETKKILTLHSFKDLSKELILGFPKIDFLKQSLLVMQSRAYEKAKEEEREQRFVRLTEKIIQVEIHRGIIKTENLKHDISTANKLAEHLWGERIKKYGLTY